jgi:hypothetical protein
MSTNDNQFYAREYWTGDSRDGQLVNGDGYHYFRLNKDGTILEAYEYYETEDGIGVSSLLPEMKNVGWIKDLGFDDFEVLEQIGDRDFNFIKEIHKNPELGRV